MGLCDIKKGDCMVNGDAPLQNFETFGEVFF